MSKHDTDLKRMEDELQRLQRRWQETPLAERPALTVEYRELHRKWTLLNAQGRMIA